MPSCFYCLEPVLPGEPQEPIRLLTHHGIEHHVAHHACAARQVLGSVAHLEKRCSCYVPEAEEGDDPSLSPRQNAEAALALWQRQQEESHG